MDAHAKFEVLRTIVAILAGLLISFLVISLVSQDACRAVGYFLKGPFTSVRRIGALIETAVPLTFTGLAVSLVFTGGQFNLGAEGQFFLGGVAATAAGVVLDLPPILHVLVSLAAGTAAGSLAGLVPGFLKIRWGAEEIVSSLMLNYVYVGLGMYLVTYHLKDPSAAALVSLPLKDTSWLPRFIPLTDTHAGLLLALLVAAFVHCFLYKTRKGYEIRMMGHGADFARYSGIPVTTVLLLVHVMSGAVAGLGGAVELLGIYRRFQWIGGPGYGFDGIIAAILARNKPIYVPLGALFLAYLRVGADVMAMYTDVSSEMVAVIQAVIMLLVTAEAFLSRSRHRLLLKGVK